MMTGEAALTLHGPEKKGQLSQVHTLVFSKQLRSVSTYTHTQRSAAPQGSSGCSCDQQAKPYDPAPHVAFAPPSLLLFSSFFSLPSYRSIQWQTVGIRARPSTSQPDKMTLQ